MRSIKHVGSYVQGVSAPSALPGRRTSKAPGGGAKAWESKDDRIVTNPALFCDPGPANKHTHNIFVFICKIW